MELGAEVILQIHDTLHLSDVKLKIMVLLGMCLGLCKLNFSDLY